MDKSDLQKMFDGYNREIHVLDRTRYKNPEVSPHHIAHLYQLSIGIQNTIRGLSAYDDAVEQYPLLAHLKTYCPEPGYGKISPIRNSEAFTRICALEDMAYQVQNVGKLQLQRLQAKGIEPNLQLELGVQGLKQLTPKSFSASFNTLETVNILQDVLQKIHDTLPAQPSADHDNWTAHVGNERTGLPIKLLKDLLVHTREALASDQNYDYRAQEALPLLLDNADTLLKELQTASKPQLETVDALFGLLRVITEELPQSHANDALKRKAQTLNTQRYTSQVIK